MGNHFFLLGSFLGGVGVVLGAFGAHALEARLTPELLATFETGVRYQIYHALALLIVALVPARKSGQRMLTISGWLFVTGILFFSGSLYLLTLTGLRSLGLIAPSAEWRISLAGSFWPSRPFGVAREIMENSGLDPRCPMPTASLLLFPSFLFAALASNQ